MAAHTTPPPRRIRRAPEDAVREILDTAESMLAARSFRELSVDDLMRGTGMTRSSFYHYFGSLDEVAVALMRRVQGEMMEAAGPWLHPTPDEDPVGATERGLLAVANVFARHGRVLAAIHEASFQSQAVQGVWREGILEDWIRTVAGELRSQRSRGWTRVENPEEIARALLLMNTAVLVERLGRPPADSPEAVAETLSEMWIGVIYPEALARRRGHG